MAIEPLSLEEVSGQIGLAPEPFLRRAFQLTRVFKVECC